MCNYVEVVEQASREENLSVRQVLHFDVQGRGYQIFRSQEETTQGWGKSEILN